VLGLERVPARREVAFVLAVSEEERALVAVDGELRVHGDVLIGVLVDDEVLNVVRARDHHLAHATLDEIHDPHVALRSGWSSWSSWSSASLRAHGWVKIIRGVRVSNAQRGLLG